MTPAVITFDERLTGRFDRLAPAEQRVALYLRDNRAEALIASAAELAENASTSDATVVRTAKALGFGGLDALKRALADELHKTITPADRLTRTLDAIGLDVPGALAASIDLHISALEAIRLSLPPEEFASAVAQIVQAPRVLVFGIGPSSALAAYVVTQFRRQGLDAESMTNTGLLFADDLCRLRRGDLVMIFAYGRVYAELDALLDAGKACGANTLLVTDTLAASLRGRVDRVLVVARGKADMLSMHTATLGLVEALLVGIAVSRPRESVAHLERLNRARSRLAGARMDLPTGEGMRDVGKPPRRSKAAAAPSVIRPLRRR